MRIHPPHILPGCEYCDYDHDPAIPCRFMPESPRFQLNQTESEPAKTKTVRLTSADGALIGVRTVRIVWEE